MFVGPPATRRATGNCDCRRTRVLHPTVGRPHRQCLASAALAAVAGRRCSPHHLRIPSPRAESGRPPTHRSPPDRVLHQQPAPSPVRPPQALTALSTAFLTITINYWVAVIQSFLCISLTKINVNPSFLPNCFKTSKKYRPTFVLFTTKWQSLQIDQIQSVQSTLREIVPLSDLVHVTCHCVLCSLVVSMCGHQNKFFSDTIKP